MTRLTKENLHGLEPAIFDLELQRITGQSLVQVCCFAAGLQATRLAEANRKHKVAIVPITTGQGLIEGFGESIQALVEYLGFKTFVTGKTDVAGIADGMKQGADLIFLADDDQFIALDCRHSYIVDNADATGRGYISVLNSMAGGLAGQQLLVLGAGPVGISASAFAIKLGAVTAIYDPDHTKTDCFRGQGDILIETDLRQALQKYKYLVDACPAGSFIDLEDIRQDVMIAAPGIPLGLTARAKEALKERLFHEPLLIGVATMLTMIVANNNS